MAETSRTTSPPQDKRTAGMNAGPAPARINWERLNIWFWRLLALASPLLPALDRIDLNATRGCGVILHWGELGPALPV